MLHVNSQKRITPITYSSNGASAAKKVHKDDRQLYSPPSGKFSEKAGAFSEYRGVTLETVSSLWCLSVISQFSTALPLLLYAYGCVWSCFLLVILCPFGDVHNNNWVISLSTVLVQVTALGQ